MSMMKYFVLFLLLIAFVGAPSFLPVNANPDTILNISVASSKKTYNYREPISLVGNFVQNGVPVTNGTVGIAVYDSSSLPISL